MILEEVIRAPANFTNREMKSSVFPIDAFAVLFPIIVNVNVKEQDALATYMENRTTGSTKESFKTPIHSLLVLKQQNLQLRKNKNKVYNA